MPSVPDHLRFRVRDSSHCTIWVCPFEGFPSFRAWEGKNPEGSFLFPPVFFFFSFSAPSGGPCPIPKDFRATKHLERCFEVRDVTKQRVLAQLGNDEAASGALSAGCAQMGFGRSGTGFIQHLRDDGGSPFGEGRESRNMKACVSRL